MSSQAWKSGYAATEIEMQIQWVQLVWGHIICMSKSIPFKFAHDSVMPLPMSQFHKMSLNLSSSEGNLI